MDFEKLKSGLLIDQDKKEVGVYIGYLKEAKVAKKADGTLINWWFSKINSQAAIDVFKKVKATGVYIDGETVTLNYVSNKLVPNYNYQAYRNRVLFRYPETEIDIQNVFKGDSFEFSKKSGKVVYSHTISDPFALNPEIVGCYCIIKNKRGEFLEILNKTDLDKMRAVAKTKYIWDSWYSEMTLKSVVKRACKRHFNDITGEMDKVDNENYDFDSAAPPQSIYDTIETYKDAQSLIDWAGGEENSMYHNDQAFRKAVSDKVDQLKPKNQEGGKNGG